MSQKNEEKLVSGYQPEITQPEITLRDFQQLIRKMYYEKDAQRGAEPTFLWLMEEVGELAAAVRCGSKENRHEEFADVLAWLSTIANILDIDLTEAVMKKYGAGCPGCGKLVCVCDESEKP
ncbi:MAG: MazG nucleotide pyrophosphohydrolase domain-containing protein [Thermoguttaceae bacterium]